MTTLVTMPKTFDPEKLQAAMKRKGMKTADDLVFATRLAGHPVSRQAIVNLLKGNSGGSIVVAGKLLKPLGLKLVDDLLTDE